MKLLRTIWLVGFLGLMSVASQQVSRADAMQPPRFTLTDLGSVDGQPNPYTPPTGYSMNGVYSSDPYKPGYRVGWTFTKDGSTTNLLPDNMANDVNIRGYNLRGYSSVAPLPLHLGKPFQNFFQLSIQKRMITEILKVQDFIKWPSRV